MEDLVLSCLESRVEQNRNLYARFLVGPFPKGNALTVGTALRRVLLSSIESIGITALYIQGITHEFSTITGVRESVLELSLNFQQIVLFQNESKAFSKDTQIGYLQVQGPRVVYANDLKLPLGVELVDPTQYIATLSAKGLLVVKFLIGHSSHHRVKHSHLKKNFTLTSLNAKNILKVKNSAPRGLKKPSLFVQNKTLLTPFYAQSTISEKVEHQSLRTSSISSQLDRCYKNAVFVPHAAGSKLCLNKSQVNKQTTCFAGIKVKSCSTRRFVHKPALRSVTQFSRFKTRTDVIVLSNNTLREVKASNRLSFQADACLRNVIPLDTMLTPVSKVNFVVETDDLYNTTKERLIFEVWTNGSIHPRQAIHEAALSLLDLFSPLRNLFQFNAYLAPTIDIVSTNQKRNSLRLKHTKKITRTKLLLSMPVLCLCLTKRNFVQTPHPVSVPQKDILRDIQSAIQGDTSPAKLSFRVQKQSFPRAKSKIIGNIMSFIENKAFGTKAVAEQNKLPTSSNAVKPNKKRIDLRAKQGWELFLQDNTSVSPLKKQQTETQTDLSLNKNQTIRTNPISQMCYNVHSVGLRKKQCKVFASKKLLSKVKPIENTLSKTSEKQSFSYTYVGDQSFIRNGTRRKTTLKTGFGYRFLPLFVFSLFKENYKSKQTSIFSRMLIKKDVVNSHNFQKIGRSSVASFSPLSFFFSDVESTDVHRLNQHVQNKGLKCSKLQNHLLVSGYKRRLDRVSFLESDVSNLPFTLKTLHFLKQKGVHRLHDLLSFSWIDLLELVNGDKQMFCELKRFLLTNQNFVSTLSVSLRTSSVSSSGSVALQNKVLHKQQLQPNRPSKRHKSKHLK